MICLRPKRTALALVAAVLTTQAPMDSTIASEAELARPFFPAVTMDKDRRLAPEAYARRAGLDPDGLRERIGASGLVRCGSATGTGQLTLRSDVITTAAHVLIDRDGWLRVGCVFEPMLGEGPVPIDFASIRTGSATPLQQPATRDWAVARLVAPVPNARPYGVADAGATPASVFMCAGGNREHAAIGTEDCSARGVVGTSREGIREIAIDCNAGPGSSGAALIGTDNKIMGIYVGYRSSSPQQPQAFSKTHYNFAITVDGPFRRALFAAAER